MSQKGVLGSKTGVSEFTEYSELVFSVFHIRYIPYRVIIELLCSQNNRSNSNYNQIFDYEFRMQHLRTKAKPIKPVPHAL
jgi:hypothetical protein